MQVEEGSLGAGRPEADRESMLHDVDNADRELNNQKTPRKWTRSNSIVSLASFRSSMSAKSMAHTFNVSPEAHVQMPPISIIWPEDTTPETDMSSQRRQWVYDVPPCEVDAWQNNLYSKAKPGKAASMLRDLMKRQTFLTKSASNFRLDLSSSGKGQM